ncbi:MAG: hypothetical protein IKN64_05355 [Desulfovibrio sp.]|nr:hypothetical protein [Desulfovibrio sp.]
MSRETQKKSIISMCYTKNGGMSFSVDFTQTPYRRVYRIFYIRGIPDVMPKVFRGETRKPADNANQRVFQGKNWAQKKPSKGLFLKVWCARPM